MGLQLEIQNIQVPLSRGWYTLFISHYPQKFQVKFPFKKILTKQKSTLSWEGHLKIVIHKSVFLSPQKKIRIFQAILACKLAFLNSEIKMKIVLRCPSITLTGTAFHELELILFKPGY